MKIEHYIVGVVILVLLTACGAYKRSVHEDMDLERRALALSDMSGIGVVNGNARMSEGVSVMETEVHYSLPDSSGRQHVTKTVTRQTDVKREADAEVLAEDSISVKVAEVVEEQAAVVSDKETEAEGGVSRKTVVFVLLVLGVILALKIDM